MSIFGSLTTAVLGLNAQSKALGHISDNIANASTLGYKRVDSAFETLVLQSNERLHAPGGVVAKPVFMNNIQGALSQVQSPTNAAIQGQGFFSVSKLSRGLTGPGQSGETVQTQTGTLNADNVYYTRVGDFELDKNRYLVNSAGFALNGWQVDETTGQLKKDVVQPIQVSAVTDKPQSTSSITLGANLPATPKPGIKVPDSSIQIYDTQGNSRTVQFNWRQDGANNWRLGIVAPGSSTQPVAGTFTGGTAKMALGTNISGVTPVAQVSQVLVNGTSFVKPSTVAIGGRSNFYPDGSSQPNIRIGDTYSVTINGGAPLSLTVTAANIGSYPDFAAVANNLMGQINAIAGQPYKASIDPNDATKIVVTTANDKPVQISGSFSTSGAPQQSTVSSPLTNANGGGPGIQQSTYTFSTTAVDVGDEFRVTVAGTEFKTRITSANAAALPNIAAVVANLATQISAAGLGITAAPGAAPNTNQLVITGSAATSTFTTSAGITNADTATNNVTGSSPATFTALTAATTPATAGTPEVTLYNLPAGALKVPDEYSVTVLGQTFTTKIGYSNINTLKDMAGVVKDLVTQINQAGLAVNADVNSTGALRLTGTTNGVNLNSSASKLAITATDNVRVGDKYTVTIDSVPYSVEVTADNIGTIGTYDGLANAVATKINSARPSAPVIATVTNSQVTLTARNPGTPFKMDQQYTSGTATSNKINGPTISPPTENRGQQQVFSFPQTQIDIGDRYTITIDGKPVSVAVDSTNYGSFEDITGVAQELANKINAAGLNVTASATNGRLTIVHNTPNTGKFTAIPSVDNATGSSGTLSGGTITTNVAGVNQQRAITLTGSPGDVGAVYSVTIDQTTISYTTKGDETSMEDITAKLADLVNANTSLSVTAGAVGSVLTLTSKTQSGVAADQFSVDPFTSSGQTPAYVQLGFGTNKDNVGTITSISTAKVGTGSAVTNSNQTTGADATVTFTVDYGFGPQQITLNLGKFGKSGGLTQYAGSEINVTQLVQDGASRGQFKEVVYGDNGDVIVNYDNGRSRVIGRIPVVTFNNPNALQREAGGVFIETEDGGRPNFNDPDTNGAGAVVANSVESSNVDIADEFTKLIVTQRTYSANTKIVTTSDEMLQEVLGLKR
ncbi:flagellar hook-basal body complex protein [Azospirillum thermophilum]|uniref:Flagellar hook protein FlgE n=1 Tax=Azospirillum thermophilum TaxID=2202148 RepID=A0A2S2CW57_9PROT|nr:flagellar hook-basal body complex protein [Azospirillum thermophilum]AWK88698.1 flagellar hook protein (modular protein) [Azospirillum thermophilum]